MDRLIVSEPSDIFFPLSREVFEDPYVVYHGTGVMAAQFIETNGCRAGEIPYEWSNVLKVLTWCKQVRLEFSDTENGYAVLRAFSAGGNDCYIAAKPVSFSISYWSSRNYAKNVDGETISNLRMVLSKLRGMATDLEERDLHSRVLRDAMKRSSQTYYEALREPVERLETGFLEERLPEITHLIEKYAHRVGNFPAVLAVRLEERQVATESRSKLGLDRWCRAEVRTIPEAIVRPDQLVARIEFPHGVRYWESFADRPLPLPWEFKTRRLNDLDDELKAVYERGFH